jgi:hypothetical protein
MNSCILWCCNNFISIIFQVNRHNIKVFPNVGEAPPSSSMDSTVSPKVKTVEGGGVGSHSRTCSTLGVEGACWSSGMGLGQATSTSIIHIDLHKPSKLVSAKLDHFLCTDKSRANTNSQNSPWPRLEGSHHLPPYSILCA